jgi:hypothetical protein
MTGLKAERLLSPGYLFFEFEKDFAIPITECQSICILVCLLSYITTLSYV